MENAGRGPHGSARPRPAILDRMDVTSPVGPRAPAAKTAPMVEAEIRTMVKEAACRRFARDPATLIVEEMVVDRYAARIDVAVVNGALHGFEIKSARDTLARLPRQVESYARVFDTVTLVVAERHLARATEVAPVWWGIEVAVPSERGDGTLRRHRRATQNPAVDPLALAALLWRAEAIALLDERGLAVGLRGRPRRELWTALAELVPVEELGQYVRGCLRARSGWRAPS